MKAYVGITDFTWYQFLSSQKDLDEVNFWQPGGQKVFSALKPGELFLFKLHSPHKSIVGGGFFAYATLSPVSLAWDSFREKNGVSNLNEMRRRIERYRRTAPLQHEDYKIGCVLLQKPFFLSKDIWIQAPHDWHHAIVQGKGYNLREGPGKELWDRLIKILPTIHPDFLEPEISEDLVKEQYGKPIEVLPRLGQGSFRILVADTYNRSCAVTRERTLPALEAAHIKPFSESGPHSVDNGIFFRSDIHQLFDKGYVTISPNYHFEVSRRIKEEFENGRDYYALNGQQIYLPDIISRRPNRKFIEWHNDKIYLG